ncbi:hypothetical protein CFOL_v3_12476 [Cephalotus follicularis]|uniref:Spatacsin C-terminal domain-containing protein n=1 Tax=Cephalotus follicularis TaxID=3775 RepID=A0A1Q3BM88_CEPFO|nr:hypothetical protein CFOL_v3_12476 [Cephalotus follicularis]
MGFKTSMLSVSSLAFLIENGRLAIFLLRYSTAVNTNRRNSCIHSVRHLTMVNNIQTVHYVDYTLSAYKNFSTNTGTTTGFRMAVLTSLQHFNPNDLDAFAMVYNHFDMKHETADLLESRAEKSSQDWLLRYDKDQNEDLLDSMRYFIEAAEVHSSIDAGNKTRKACAQASLVSFQI